MFDLTGRSALVTGASGGIGRAIALALRRQGANLAVTGTRLEALERVADELGGGVHVIPADLSKPDSADKLVKQAQTALGGLDILVNNAGLARDGLLVRMKDEDWDCVMTVNLTSGFRLVRAAVRDMMKQRYGRIVGIASVVGVTGNPGQSNYAASKAGMIGFTKAVAQEVASRGITVNCVAPGFIETPMTGHLTDERKQRIQGSIPMERMGLPQEVACGVVYLASSEAGYVTGQTLHINGGMAMI